jgi:hypothetical protein
MTTDTDPVARPAMAELLDLAGQTRPDIDRRDLEGALIDARDAGCTWGWTLVTTAQILARGEGPYELHDAVRAWRRVRTGRPAHA